MTRTPRLAAHRQFQTDRELVASVPVAQSAMPCEYALKFKAFTDILLETMKEATHSVHVNRAKLLLSDQYFRLKRTAPAQHQDTVAYDGHTCIYSVYCEAYDALDQFALRVAPPAFELPPRPPGRRKKQPEIPDIFDEETIHRMIYGGGRA